MRRIVAVLSDAAMIVAFVAIGRGAHDDGASFSGLASTSWPFLVAAGLGWVISRAWRRPWSLWPAGVGAWFGAAAGGQVLRVISGQGTKVAFVAVATAFLGLFLLGWRALAFVAASRGASRRAPSAPARTPG